MRDVFAATSAVSAAALCLGIVGCQAHGKGSARFEADASMTGGVNAHAEASSEVTGGPSKLSSRIRLIGDRLEYEGEINFAYNDDALVEDATFETLGQLRDILQEHPDVHLHIEGHADSRGSDEHNLKLSDDRARSVRDWLIDHGIDEDRLTSKGLGEDQKEGEPERCRDKTGPDRLFDEACVAAWKKNRRTVLKVTTGLSALRPAQAAKAEEPPPVRREQVGGQCELPLGLHVNLLGPNSYAGLALATEPCVWWLELSLGVGYGEGSVEDAIAGQDASGDYTAWTIPLRGRFWFSPEYSSLLLDVGVGLALYDINATSTDAANNQIDVGGSYRRPIGTLGVGYGYRSDGVFRLALLVGGLFHAQPIDTFTDLSDPRPYGEASLGFYF